MPHVHKNLSKEMDQCLHNCEECHDLCTQTVQYCLEKGNQHAAPELIRVLLDCSDICETSADFMLRRSDLHPVACEACAKVCERCAESCEQISGDARMKECAEVCRRCAESCHELAGARV